jgi:glycosyltransferase involved in cell wall biosynthesis
VLEKLDKKSAVLHIVKYFYDSAVHRTLVDAKYRQGGDAYTVFCADHNDVPAIERDQNVITFKYFSVFRFFLICRTLLSLRFLTSHIDVSKYGLVFCHTWVVDGLLGYLLYKKLGIPYVITIRNTDLNFYFKRFWGYRWMFKLILKNASAIGFASVSNRRQFESLKIAKGLKKQLYIWPNILDEFWYSLGKIDCSRNRALNSPVNVAFVGRYNANKNLYGVIHAVGRLRSFGLDVRLTCAGGSNQELLKYLELGGMPYFDWIINKGVLDRIGLKTLYESSSCLCVPSFCETFGLVYIEALSQGCRVVCSIDQGIDGFFDSGVFTVDPHNYRDIALGVMSSLACRSDMPDLSLFRSNAVVDKIKGDTRPPIK